jgi:hypothetical protein
MRLMDLLLNELQFMGSLCTKDCSGHRAGYQWSLARNGRQAMSHSASFNKGAAIAAAQVARRPQGGGKKPGYVSQTPRAQRKRAQRAARRSTLPQRSS